MRTVRVFAESRGAEIGKTRIDAGVFADGSSAAVLGRQMARVRPPPSAGEDPSSRSCQGQTSCRLRNLAPVITTFIKRSKWSFSVATIESIASLGPSSSRIAR